MKEENKAKIAQWAAKLGQPIEELMKQYDEFFATYKSTIAAKDEAWYEDAAMRRLYVVVKAQLISPAVPFDYIALGCTGTLDVTAADREGRLALYANPEKRAQVLAEGKVRVIDGNPVAIDTREWMVAPAEGVKGIKNRNFGKPLEPVIIRTLAFYGRLAKGGMFKLISVLETGELTKSVPPIGGAFRSRLNLREEKTYRIDCNASRLMKFDAIQLPEYPTVTPKIICDILQAAPLYHPDTNPSGIRVPMSLLRNWHDANEKDARRLCVIVGDVTVKPAEPMRTGNYLLVVEDAEEMNFEVEGTPVWIPSELATQLDFASGSRVVAIGRTNIGPGRNPDTGQFDASIERVQLNAAAIFAIPEYRIPPESLEDYIE